MSARGIVLGVALAAVPATAATAIGAPSADATGASTVKHLRCAPTGKATARHRCCKPGKTAARKGKRRACLKLRAAGAYKLVYTHRSSWTLAQPYSNPPRQGTGTSRRVERWALKATIPLKGNPATGLTGSGPITYTQAQVSDSTTRHELAGQADVWCDSTSSSTLTGTTAGTATASVTFTSPRAVSLSFDPGQPRESYHASTTVASGPCGDADSHSTSSLWLNRFTLAPAYARYPPARLPIAVTTGWKAGRGNVIATLSVDLKSFPADVAGRGNGEWHDTYQIVRGH